MDRYRLGNGVQVYGRQKLRKIGIKIFISFLCMAAITIGLLWFIQAVFLKNSYLDQRVDSIDTALKGVPDENNIDYAALEAEHSPYDPVRGT